MVMGEEGAREAALALPPSIVLTGPPGLGPIVAGEALVSGQGFSARYDLNRRTGLSLLHRLKPDPTTAIQTGDWLRLDPGAGTVQIWRRAVRAG
jgi:hypothetical protein